jgi:HEAT repeat protein
VLYAPLPRTLPAALRDVREAKAAVRASAVGDLARHAQNAGSDADRSAIVEALIAALGDEAPRVREAAAEALGDTRSTEALPALLVAVEDDDPIVRQKAIAALGELGDARAQTRLERALSDARPEVRFQAVMAFPRVTTSRTAASIALARAARDDDEHVAYVALRMGEELAAASDEPLDPALLDVARDRLRHPSARLRAVAAVLLGAARDRAGVEVIGALVRGDLTTDEPEDLAEALLLAGDLGLRDLTSALEHRAFRGFLGLMRDPFAWHARTALARLGHPRATEAILVEVRRGAATAIEAAERARVTAALPLLRALIASHPDTPRELVLRAIATIEASGGSLSTHNPKDAP